MGLFSGYENKGMKAANRMGERNEQLQERLYHLTNEGLINEGGPDWGGLVNYATDMPIQSPQQLLGQSLGLANVLSDKSPMLRDLYQDTLLNSGIQGILNNFGVNTDVESFGGLPGFWSGQGGFLNGLWTGAGGGQQLPMGIPGGAQSLTGGQPAQTADVEGTIQPALDVQGSADGESYQDNPWFQGTQAMQNLRMQQQQHNQNIANQLLEKAGLGQTPGVSYADLMGGIGNIMSQYDPNQFARGQELLMGAKPRQLRQAEAAQQAYGPMMGMPMAQAAPGGQGAGQGRRQFMDILGLLTLGGGLADEFGLLDSLGGMGAAPQQSTAGSGFNWFTPGVGAGAQGGAGNMMGGIGSILGGIGAIGGLF